jgi:tRNA(adenine34) deaminase
VGAVLVRDERLLGRGQNHVERLHDPTAHAEMMAIRQVCADEGFERLSGVTLYVTLEPCAMCAGALVLARIDRLVFGTADPKSGACGSLRNIVRDPRLNHRVALTQGILAEECASALQDFFRARRAERN